MPREGAFGDQHWKKHRSLIHDPSMVGGERNIIIRDWASQTVNCHSLIMYIPRFEMQAEHDFQVWENLLAAMSINIRPQMSSKYPKRFGSEKSATLSCFLYPYIYIYQCLFQFVANDMKIRIK